MVILDIEKPCYNVWHNGLAYKFITYNFHLYLTKLINNYLTNRKVSSNPKIRSVIAGASQDSIIGHNVYHTSLHLHQRHPEGPKYIPILPLRRQHYYTCNFHPAKSVLYVQNYFHSLQNYYTSTNMW